MTWRRMMLLSFGLLFAGGCESSSEGAGVLPWGVGGVEYADTSEPELRDISVAFDTCEMTVGVPVDDDSCLAKHDAGGTSPRAKIDFVGCADRRTASCDRDELEHLRGLFTEELVAQYQTESLSEDKTGPYWEIGFIAPPGGFEIEAFTVDSDTDNPTLRGVIDYLAALHGKYWPTASK